MTKVSINTACEFIAYIVNIFPIIRVVLHSEINVSAETKVSLYFVLKLNRKVEFTHYDVNYTLLFIRVTSNIKVRFLLIRLITFCDDNVLFNRNLIVNYNPK